MADNLNISPDMIENLVNILKTSGIAESFSSQNSENTNNTSKINDNSSCKYSENIKNISGNSESFSDQNSGSAATSNNNNFNTFSGIDFETIMKMKSIMETLNNSNDQDSKLLYSLKPYLRKSRQAKLDQYINILKISQVSKFFNKKGDAN